MTFTEREVERIVVEVIRRLGLLGAAAADGSSKPAIGAAELRVTDRVVTMRAIDGRLAGVTRVVVQPRAVVTPAVKDELRKRRIDLVSEAHV